MRITRTTTELGRSTTDQPRNGSTTAPGPKSCRQQVGMCCCALLLDFDAVDMLNKINKHVCCKAPSSSVCPSCLRHDHQSRSQSLFYVRAACLHVVLFFSCCRGRVWPDVFTDLPFLKRRSTPKSVSLFFVAAATWDLQEAFVSQLTILTFVCGVALPSTPRRHDGMLFRPNPLPKWSPSAHVAQVEMSRGTLTCLSQTGECFLLTFDLGRQDVNNKNNHGMG